MRLRYLALRSIRSLGYDIRKVADPSGLEIEDAGTDPLTLEYNGAKRGHAIFMIRLDDCRGFHALGLPLDPARHPFVRALKAVLDDWRAESAAETIRGLLADYYSRVTPANALEVLDLDAQQAPGLLGVPALGFLFPWQERGVEALIASRNRSLAYLAMRHGRLSDARDGYTFFGPCGEGLIALEARRLAALARSVRENGFNPFVRNSPIKVIGMRRDGEMKWLIEEGQHRFAMGGALNVPKIPAVMTMIVRREDAVYWPQVVNGTFGVDGAIALFDRLFDGQSARVAGRWIEDSRVEPIR